MSIDILSDEPKWSPSPWHKAAGLVDVTAADGGDVVNTSQTDSRRSPEEMDANADLIASAPELYAIAMEHLALLRSDYTGRGGKDLTGGEIAKVERVLAKARGESEATK